MDDARTLGPRMEADLDPNEVAAYVAGRLTSEERASFEARAAADPEAQLLLRTLRRDAAPRRAVAWAWAGAAAAVLLVVGGTAWIVARRPLAPTEVAGVPERLVAAAADLARADPTSFDAFAPYRSDELVPAKSVTRGGVRWLAPRGTVLAAPTELRWSHPPRGGPVDVSIEGPDLAWSQAFAEERAPAPPLPPGRYVVTIRALASLAGNETRAGFVVAGADLRAEVERAATTIRRHAPPDLADLLLAHWALRRDLREEARAAAARAAEHGEAVRDAAQALLRFTD
jgi:hypothetical protein